MDIRQLKYFIAVAESKNLSQAARSLFITQPTLSQTIRKMESELNTNLYVHNDKSFQLTHSGKLLYDRGKTIVEDFDCLIDEIQNVQNDYIEKIRVGLTVLFTLQFMKQISKFIATHPNVELHIIQDGSYKLQKKLADGEIDIALISYPLFQSSLDIEPLQTTTKGYDVSVVVPSNHPLSDRKSIGFKDLKEESFSSLTDDFMLGRMLLERCRYIGFEPNIVFTHNDWEVLIHSLVNLNSVCILPSAFESFSHVKNIKWISLADKNNYYPIGIALRKNFTCSQVMTEFISMIKTN